MNNFGIIVVIITIVVFAYVLTRKDVSRFNFLLLKVVTALFFISGVINHPLTGIISVVSSLLFLSLIRYSDREPEKYGALVNFTVLLIVFVFSISVIFVAVELVLGRLF